MEPEYVVTVKRWPAFLLGVLLIVLVGLLVAEAFLLAGLSSTDGGLLTAFALVVVGSVAVIALAGWSMLRLVTVIRHPPRLTAQGMRLWLIPASAYVFVPWSQITAVRATTKGLGTGLFVHVDRPDGLVDGDQQQARKISRFARRYHGAPFAYPVSNSRAGLDGIDHALRGYTNGHQALQRN